MDEKTEIQIDRNLGRWWLGRHIEVVTAVLLGLVSCMTAYTGFQAALYNSTMASSFSKAQVLSTQAESLYLAANQDYTQDAQLWSTLSELAIDIESADPDTVSRATAKYNTLFADIVTENFAAAIERANTVNNANPDDYVSPLDDEIYLETLFGPSYDTADGAEEQTAIGDRANSFGDQLGLYTVLMTIALFLLGVAAVVKRNLIKFLLIGFSVVVFLVASILTLMVPFVALG